MEHVKIGFIGAGNIAKKHLDRLQYYPDVTIDAFCDVNVDTAEEKSATYTDGHAKVYASYEKMLDTQELDAVYVCVPPNAHGYIERAACKRSVHMFIEKPIHLDLEDALIVEDYIKQHDIITSVGYHWRYNAPNKHARTLIQANPHILGATCAWILDKGPDIAWWYNEKVSGGQHHEQTTHLFDTLRYILGDETQHGTQVQGFAQKGWIKHNKELKFVTAMSVINLRFAFGPVATITSCCQSNTSRVQIEVLCEGLNVVLGSEGNHYYEKPDKKMPLDDASDIDALDRAFIHAVKTGDRKKIRSDYSDALKTLRLTCAAAKSFENHGRVITV